MRILLIEDNGPLRNIAVKILSAAGFEVLDAEDGETGLRLWREQGADVLLTDLHIGTPNGIEVAQEIRVAAPALPVIIMSGSTVGDEHLVTAARLLGRFGTLEKPFAKGELLAVIAQQVGAPPEKKPATD